MINRKCRFFITQIFILLLDNKCNHITNNKRLWLMFTLVYTKNHTLFTLCNYSIYLNNIPNKYNCVESFNNLYAIQMKETFFNIDYTRVVLLKGNLFSHLTIIWNFAILEACEYLYYLIVPIDRINKITAQ